MSEPVTPCAVCQRSTPYLLALAAGPVPCCGKFACETKLKTGVDVADRPKTLASAMLEKLHDIAARNLPKPASPERIAEFREKSAARLRGIGHEQVFANVMAALEPAADFDFVKQAEDLWATWDGETDLQRKAEVQMQLGEHVAGLLETIDALRQREGGGA